MNGNQNEPTRELSPEDAAAVRAEVERLRRLGPGLLAEILADLFSDGAESPVDGPAMFGLAQELKARLVALGQIDSEAGHSQNDGGGPQYLTVPEAAKALAVSEGLVRELIHRKELKAARIGRLIRIPRSEIDKRLQ